MENKAIIKGDNETGFLKNITKPRCYTLADELLENLKELRDNPEKHKEFFDLYIFSDDESYRTTLSQKLTEGKSKNYNYDNKNVPNRPESPPPLKTSNAIPFDPESVLNHFTEGLASIKPKEINDIKQKKKFLVGLQCGGLMESPEIYYTDKEVIEAYSKKEAVEIYNKKHNCSYFYGHCFGEVKGKKKKVEVDLDDMLDDCRYNSIIRSN